MTFRAPPTPSFLRHLPPGWEVVRGGPLRGAVRWLAVGPGGGAVISEIPYRSRIRVRPAHLVHAGTRTPDADQARDAGWLLCSWLTDLAGEYVPVRPLLVHPSGLPPVVDEPAVGYAVRSRRTAGRWLAALPRQMAAPDAHALARAARESD
jgi:hypothetical protein